jgi:hypothetical protein
LLAGAVLAAGLAGCGIPDETDVVTHGRPGPSPGMVPGGDSTRTGSTRDATRDREEFVANYLAAAAGEPEGAVDRVREFMAPGVQATFKPPQEIRVVRLTEKPLINPGRSSIQLHVQHLGILKPTGELAPPKSRETKYELTVTDEGAQGLFVTDAPPLLLLSQEALDNQYQRRLIYFWNREYTALVPDLRYLPVAVPRERQPTKIVEWLTAGPSDWLESAVELLPDNTKPINNAADVGNGKLQVNLTAAAVPAGDEQAVERLGAQLLWSLRPYLTGQLELKIEGQVRRVFGREDHLHSNPSYGLPDRPESFCVYEGQVRRLISSVNPTDPVPLLTGEVNRGVRSAALGRAGDTTYAALVVADGAGQALRVGAAGPGQTVTFTRARLPGGTTSRPVWASLPADGAPGGGVGLVVAGGRLYHFSSDGTDPRPVDLPDIPGPLSTVAVAPDGHRIAFIAGGRLFVTVVTASGTRWQATSVREVRTSLRQLAGVGWTAEDLLIAAGVSAASDRVTIIDTTVDGAVEYGRLTDLGTARVTGLVAHPVNPTSTGGGGTVAYVADDVAFAGSARIQASQVGGVTPSPGSTAQPTAPFFLE